MSRNTPSILQVFTIVVYPLLIVLLISLAPTDSLAGNFTYNGKGIRDWPSVGTAGIMSNTTGTVRHKQTRLYKQDKHGMTVYIRKQEWWGWKDIASKTFIGSTSGSFSAKCSPGTYKLHFLANDSLYKYDISGSFSWLK